MMTVTILYILNINDGSTLSGESALGLNLVGGWHIPLTAGILMTLLVLAIDMLTPRKKIATISGVFFGLLVGLIATFAINFIIDLLVQTYEIKAPNLVSAIKVLCGICLCYLGMSVVLQTQDDFRLVIPYVEFAKQLRGPRPLLIDTSALIDSRIVDLAATGIFGVPLVVPRFVIHELQALADSDDKLKRARGRRGLEVIGRLQRHPALDITIDETHVVGKSVDQMLVELARTMPATVVTADVALNRVAAIQGVEVLNLNEVANALKPSLIPGTHLMLPLLRRGEQPGQAVGYLDDGTMVVVERAESAIGREVELEVTSAMQTSAGRLIFARLVGVAGVGDDADGGEQVDSPPSESAAAPQPDHEENHVTRGNAAPITPPLTIRPSPSAPPAKPGPFPPVRPVRSTAPRNPRR
jgi:uncharacterized protein YacL